MTVTATDNTDYKFEGWAGFDVDSVKGNLKWTEYTPKTFAPDDVDIKIQYCGICASDISTLNGGWGDISKMYPQVVGHEIVGLVTRVGDKVENDLKVGDLVGVGAQCDSCLECENCNNHMENYCNKGFIGTYNGVFDRNTKDEKSYGGYANYWRGPSHFVVKIPSHVDPADAAPFLCGGGTVFAPLKQYGAGTAAKKVGVIGIGGLGHFALLFAKAMGAEVTAISHSAHKEKDARELGADHVLVTGSDIQSAVAPHRRSLDLIICCSNDPKMPMDAYLSLLKPKGNFILVGAPETPHIAPFSAMSLIFNNIHVGGSLIASPQTLKDMLAFIEDKHVKPWVTKWPMDKVNEAVPSMDAGKARYRYVLVNEANGGKL